MPIDHALDDRDIEADIRAVYGDWKEQAMKFRLRNNKVLPVQVSGQTLKSGSDSFVVGDPVVVVSELTRQVFEGTLASLNQREVCQMHKSAPVCTAVSLTARTLPCLTLPGLTFAPYGVYVLGVVHTDHCPTAGREQGESGGAAFTAG